LQASRFTHHPTRKPPKTHHPLTQIKHHVSVRYNRLTKNNRHEYYVCLLGTIESRRANIVSHGDEHHHNLLKIGHGSYSWKPNNTKKKSTNKLSIYTNCRFFFINNHLSAQLPIDYKTGEMVTVE